MAGYEDRRREAHAALNAAETAWHSIPAETATVLPAWMAREHARAALFGVELAREKAAGVLGHGLRPAKLPRPDLAGDLALLLNGWARDQLSAAEEAVNEGMSAATTEKASTS